MSPKLLLCSCIVPTNVSLGRAPASCPRATDSGEVESLLLQLCRHGLQDSDKHWQLVILAHSMGNRPTTMALGKVYTDEKAALQLNTADLPMLVRLCTISCVRQHRLYSSITAAWAWTGHAASAWLSAMLPSIMR